MLADLLLPFPISHPSTVPSDLIHPPLRNGTLLLDLLIHLLLVCSSSLSSPIISLKPLYILRFSLSSVFYCLPPRFSFSPTSSISISIFRPFSKSPFPDPFSSSSTSRDANDIAILVDPNEYRTRSTKPLLVLNANGNAIVSIHFFFLTRLA